MGIRPERKQNRGGTKQILSPWRWRQQTVIQSQEHRKESAGTLRILLDWSNTFMHAHKCMRSHFHALMECTFMHSSNLRILGLSAHVCRLIRASSDRKQGVTQGEMFVMEIWTAGVGKQSWRPGDDILYTWANREWGITNQNLKSENKGFHIDIPA